jgi:hypothetical protein
MLPALFMSHGSSMLALTDCPARDRRRRGSRGVESQTRVPSRHGIHDRVLVELQVRACLAATAYTTPRNN